MNEQNNKTGRRPFFKSGGAAKKPAKASAAKPAVTSAKSAPAPKTKAQNRPAKSAQNAPKAKDAGLYAKLDTAKTEVLEVLEESILGRPKKQNSGRAKGGAKKEPRESRRTPLRIIPLGGLLEIGKNMTMYECGNDAFIVDCGLAFPDEEMPGVDVVIPDFTYVERNKDKIRGVMITHGHEDHIGGIPYLLKTVNLPIYGTKLTLGLVEGKLKEHGLLGKAKLNVVKPRDVVKVGCMSVEFIHVNHSIADACALAIHTPAGVVVQTGDFKVDYTPIENEIIDLARFGELGSRGVLALLADSTNSERPGSSETESKVGESFDPLFKRAEKQRIIIATFASNIHRVQQIVNAAVRYQRKIAVSGRSMINVVGKAVELGYLTIPEGILIDIDMLPRYRDDQIVLITTGSQGEPMSALSRMAMGDHRKVSISSRDFIIISANPIPGNEKTVNRVVNELMRLGADVIYEKMYEVHVSGHACQDEQKLMMALTRPKFFIPVHGEYKHLKKHAETALSMGIPKDHIILPELGKIIELDGVDAKFAGSVPAGKVMVDGLGVGDVGSIVLRDRRHLSEDGLLVIVATIDRATGQVVSGPDVVSRGFVYVREAEDMMNEVRKIASDVLDSCRERNIKEWGTIKTKVKDAVSDFLFHKTKRSPMILPVIQEI
ncbi:ribonuclease J [Zongyangia hominis]|uniref:ribonuclease J n=1 Tax=Zongyangia hominis TaxID=2763677 RepID=UPI0021CCA7CE|nr:ribonuclease J [Zongyangia hominis]